MNTHDTQEIALVRAVAPQTGGPSPTALLAARRVLRQRIAAEAPYVTLAPRRPERRRRRLPRPIAACLLAVAVAGLLAMPLLNAIMGPGDRIVPTGAAAPARQLLLASAELAAQEPPSAEAPYWYVHSQVSGADEEEAGREIWLGRSRPGRLVTGVGGTRGATGTSHQTFPASFFGLSWDELGALPTDTADLRNRVYELAGDKGEDPDSEAFVVIGDLLRESPAPPALRAALLRVVATIPGVRLDAVTADGVGRPVVPVSRTSTDGLLTRRLLLDPHDGRLLGEDLVAARHHRIEAGEPGPDVTGPPMTFEEMGGRDFPAGTVLFRMTVLAAGPVGELGERPGS